MVSLGHPSFPPTDLCRQDDEEASPGGKFLKFIKKKIVLDGPFQTEVKAVNIRFSKQKCIIGIPFLICGACNPISTLGDDTGEVLRHEPTRPGPKTSATMGTSSHSRLSLTKITIRARWVAWLVCRWPSALMVAGLTPAQVGGFS
ncbi:hypothetical protein TNCV_4288791 [Trichonephila clavipes]|nr:hypothetical protein TNCV_4288791 [Trichonephila clavipes]